MPKNKGKGGKNFKKGKKSSEGETRRDLIFKEDGQEYAQVKRKQPRPYYLYYINMSSGDPVNKVVPKALLIPVVCISY